MTITEKIADKKIRMGLYRKKEADILTGGVKAYGIGGRNLQRYDAALSEVRTAIKELEAEIDGLEAQQRNGGCPRKAVGVIPRDL